jgi:hypothetical protein
MFSDWCWFAVLLLPWQDCLWLQDLRSTTLCQKQSWNLMEFPLGIRISVDSHWFAEFMYDQTAGSSLDSDLSDLASMRIEVYWRVLNSHRQSSWYRKSRSVVLPALGLQPFTWYLILSKAWMFDFVQLFPGLSSASCICVFCFDVRSKDRYRIIWYIKTY